MILKDQCKLLFSTYVSIFHFPLVSVLETHMYKLYLYKEVKSADVRIVHR